MAQERDSFAAALKTLQLEVEEARPTRNPQNGIVRFGVRLTNQRGEVVLQGFHTYLIKRRTA